MASGLMIDDRLQIDGFNPSTWTGDFGINKDGFPKTMVVSRGYTTAIDETPMEVNDVGPVMNSTDLAGNTYLKTAAPSVAPYRTFPARKFEYSDGTVTWVRPLLPWCWLTGPQEDGKKGNNDLLIILVVIALVLFFLRTTKF